MSGFKTIQEMFDFSAKAYSEKKAFFWKDEGTKEVITYGELHEIALKFAGAMLQHGIKKDDKIMMQLPEPAMYGKGFWGCVYCGAVPLALPFSMADLAGRDVLEKQLNICSQMGKLYILIPQNYKKDYEKAISPFFNVQLLIYEEIMREAENIIPEDVRYPTVQREDICCILFSSGSTDYPKGVVLKQKTMVASILGALDIIDYTENENSLSWLPMTHAFGFIGFHLIPICCGANQGIMPPSMFVKNPKEFLNKVSQYKITVFGAMNFALKILSASITDEELQNLDLSNVKHLFLGAEPVNAEIANSFADRFSVAKLDKKALRPIYGLSESAFAIACAKNNEHFRTDRLNIKELADNHAVYDDSGDTVQYVSVGVPVTGLEFIVVDDKGNALPENHIGELCYAGDCISDSYYFEKNENAKHMVGKYLCSGDLGYYSNGEIIITGRKKDIIFINGQNYYPLDIENRIAREVPEFKDRVVACQIYNYQNQPELILFVEYQGKTETFVEKCIKVLDQAIKNTQYLKFDEYLPIAAIPKTSSGKVKRIDLKKKYQTGFFDAIKQDICREAKVEDVVFDDDESKEIQKLWNMVLYGDKKAQSGRFFEVGGDSVKLLQLSALLRKKYEIAVSLKTLVKATDIKEFVKLVKEQIHSGKREILEEIKVEPDEEHRFDKFDLTEIQRSYLLGRNQGYDMGGISTHGYYEYEVEYDIERFERALNKVIKNQDNLRLVMTDDRKQRILKDVPYYKINRIDGRNFTKEQLEEVKMEERDRMSHAVFNPEVWPLFEFQCIQISDKKSLLFFGIDLMITDASSIQMLKNMLKYYYEHENEEPEKMQFSFRDFMIGMKRIKQTDQYKADKGFWQKRLGEIPNEPMLPLKKETSDIQSSEFKRMSLLLSKEKTAALKKIAIQNGISFSSVVCTAYSMALAFYSNQMDCTLNVTIFNKYDFHPDVERMMGDFTSTILLPFRFQGKDSLQEVFAEIQEELLTGLEHRYYTGVEVLRDLKKFRNTGNKAIMPIVFTSTLDKKSDDNQELGKLLYSISQTSQVYLDCQAYEKNGQLFVIWDYIDELFDERLMQNMFERFELNLNKMDKHSALKEYFELSEWDDKIWKEYNSTEKELPYQDLYDKFMQSVLAYPDHVAVEDENGTYTYKELAKASDGVAAYLSDAGIKKGDHVAVLTHRRKETIANILGALKCGAAYVPLDPQHPENRREKIMQSSGCNLLLNELKCGKNTVSHVPVAPGDTAYIIYTSGSTGEPKGVVISHGGVSNTINDINARYEVSTEDAIIGMSSMCFDLSVYDIFGALSAGAKLVMVSEPKDIRQVAKTVIEKEITIWNSVPAFVQMYVSELQREAKKNRECNTKERYQENLLRLCIMSGDWIPVSLPKELRKELPEIEIVSMGGATEASIWSIYYPIGTVKKQWNSIPYGRPLANQNMYLLEWNGELCPIGVSGEIYIGGVGVATEYYGKEDMTKAAFINHEKYGRLYRTGDFGKLHREENEVYMEFLGRKDSQIKVRGHRIELGEIEKTLQRAAGIIDAVAYVKQIEGSDVLCAALRGNQTENTENIMNCLRRELPKYMVPAHIHYVDAFPLNINGKVDRKALADMDICVSGKQRYEAQNELEEKLHAVWKEVLGRDLSFTDNFYDLGGDSIKLFTLIERVEKLTGNKVPKDSFFKFETIEEMEEVLQKEVEI